VCVCVCVQTPGINDDFIGCMTQTLADVGSYFPARLVLGDAAAKDYYVPKEVIRRGERLLIVTCDVAWEAVSSYAHLTYARVTHREICLMTQGLKMRMWAVKDIPLSGKQRVYFFSRRAQPAALFDEVFIEVVAGAATDTASNQIIPIIQEASEQDEEDAANSP
jgi:hypothetical protein